MNVEKMIKRDISVEIANYLTNNLPCYEKKNIDDEKTYETNFLHLMNVIGKNVINIPRKVHYSCELIKKMNEEFPKELCDLIKLFEKKFDKGESVKGYLSKKAFDVEFKDILLNQWGIKHLHLTDKEANSIEEMKNNRSNILLFFIVDNQDVYFLDVRKHPKGAGFITLEVLSIVYNNRWMEKIGAQKVEGIIDLQPKIDSNEELYKLYKPNHVTFSIVLRILVTTIYLRTFKVKRNVYYRSYWKRSVGFKRKSDRRSRCYSGMWGDGPCCGSVRSVHGRT